MLGSGDLDRRGDQQQYVPVDSCFGDIERIVRAGFMHCSGTSDDFEDREIGQGPLASRKY